LDSSLNVSEIIIYIGNYYLQAPHLDLLIEWEQLFGLMSQRLHWENVPTIDSLRGGGGGGGGKAECGHPTRRKRKRRQEGKRE